MRVFKNVCAIVFLMAAIVALGCMVGLLMPPVADRVAELIELPAARIAVLACAGVTAFGVLVIVLGALLARPEPTTVHPAGNPDIAITTAALASIARAAAESSSDVMVEEVSCRVSGADRSQVRFTIDVIAFTNHDLNALALTIQRHVEQACTAMMGTSGVTARVRFLPSTTTIIQGASS